LASKTMKQYALVKPFARNWVFDNAVQDLRVGYVLFPSHRSFLFHNWMDGQKSLACGDIFKSIG
jgi:hypothetical protein